MKPSFFSISYVLLLIASLLKYSGESLPFSKTKHLYWIVLLTIIAFIFVIRNKCKILKINIFDGILILLLFLGIINFIFLSNSSVYTISIWYCAGYFAIYLMVIGYCNTFIRNQKTLHTLLYFCSSTAIANVFWMFLQWKHWVAVPNQFFVTTGFFFSPNQLGLYLSIGSLCTLFLLEKAKALWLKIILTLGLFILVSGLIISTSRGAFISFGIALAYYFYHSKLKTKQHWNWKIGLGIVILAMASIYYITSINKNKTDSTSGRYFTSQQILKQIAQNPLGYGVNSFSVEYNKGKAHYFEKNHNWAEMKNAGYIFYANNDFLELAFELGIHWIALFIVFIFLLFKKKSLITEVLLSRTILLCLIVFSLTNTMLATPIFAIVAVICVVTITKTTPSRILYECKNHFVFKIIAVSLILIAGLIQINRINAEDKLNKLYLGTKYLKGEQQLQSYVSKIEDNGEEWFMAGAVLAQNGYQKEGIHYMQRGIQLSGRPSLGKVLADYLQNQGDYTQAEKIYTYNKNAEPYRYEARMDLFDLYLKTKQNAKAKKMALEIINLPIKVPSASIVGFKRKAKLFLTEFEGK